MSAGHAGRILAAELKWCISRRRARLLGVLNGEPGDPQLRLLLCLYL